MLYSKRSNFFNTMFYKSKRTSPHHLPTSLSLEGLAPLCEPSTISFSGYYPIVRVLILAERFLSYRKFSLRTFLYDKKAPRDTMSYEALIAYLYIYYNANLLDNHNRELRIKKLTKIQTKSLGQFHSYNCVDTKISYIALIAISKS